MIASRVPAVRYEYDWALNFSGLHEPGILRLGEVAILLLGFDDSKRPVTTRPVEHVVGTELAKLLSICGLGSLLVDVSGSTPVARFRKFPPVILQLGVDHSATVLLSNVIEQFHHMTPPMLSFAPFVRRCVGCNGHFHLFHHRHRRPPGQICGSWTGTRTHRHVHNFQSPSLPKRRAGEDKPDITLPSQRGRVNGNWKANGTGRFLDGWTRTLAWTNGATRWPSSRPSWAGRAFDLCWIPSGVNAQDSGRRGGCRWVRSSAFCVGVWFYFGTGAKDPSTS